MASLQILDRKFMVPEKRYILNLKQDDGETCVNTNTRKKTQPGCTKLASSNDASTSSTKHLHIFQRPKQKLL